MSYPIIAVQALNYAYTRKAPVLRNLNLAVPQASIYGFLGANGAGKSTTIRTILGLLKPQAGQVQLFGKDITKDRINILRNTGSLIEAPSIYRHLSGYDNLKVLCQYLNLPKSRIEEVLTMVNLQQHSRKASKKYSTGMKQRLGLAMALLSDPELLILDEPTNGLDPKGIIEIRHIIRRLNEAGKTIFLSSHLLSEIEKLATQVGIIKDGTMIFQGTIQALEQLRMRNLKVQITSSETAKIIDCLAGNLATQRLDDETIMLTLDNREALPELIDKLVGAGIRLYGVSPEKNDLEKLFVDLTAQPN
jgi:ABC-2 type transport system ATP-binding protein